jgi:hypothetical protein
MTTQVPEYGGCPWPVDTACFDDEWNALSEPIRARSLALASSTLERLTGGRVGGCPVTVRPCSASGCIRQGWDPFVMRPAFVPLNWAGSWVNSCGHRTCECEVTKGVRLAQPVGRVDEVKVDGVVLDPSAYRVLDGYLVATDPEFEFPAVQSLNLPDTEPGTFSVTYLNAYEVDANGAFAVAVLAMEYAKACTGKKCRLPSSVTSVSRQGITLEMTPGAFPGGMTGIREVDSYIALWNPGGLQRGATVWSPDLHRPRAQGGPR